MGSSNERTKYRELRNRVTKLIHDSKRNYYSNMMEENSSDPNKLWKTLKTAISSNTKSTQTGSLEVDGELVCEPKNISTSFGTFFKSVLLNCDRRYRNHNALKTDCNHPNEPKAPLNYQILKTILSERSSARLNLRRLPDLKIFQLVY